MDECNINDLDDYSLIHIFSYLPIIDRVEAERVCKRWKFIIIPMSWISMKTLDLKRKTWTSGGLYKIISYNKFENIIQRCGRYVKSFDCLDHVNDINENLSINLKENLCKLINTHCPNLQAIDISGIVAKPRDIMVLANNCINITMFGIGIVESHVEKLLSVFFQHARNLEILKFWETNIVGKCLSKVSISTLKSISNLNFKSHNLESNLRNLLQRCHTLEIFVTSGLTYILKSLPKDLKEIQVLKCITITDDEFLALAERCKELSRIQLEFGIASTFKVGLPTLLTLPKMEHVCMKCFPYLTDDIFANLTQLKSLRMHFCCKVLNNGIMQLLQNSDKLELLDIKQCNGLDINSLVDCARQVTARRTNGVILKMYVDHSDALSNRNGIILTPHLHLFKNKDWF